MTSVPSTPRTPKIRKGFASSRVATPNSALLKKTILNFDPNSSYMESDDLSYVNETTEISFDEDDENIREEDDEDDEDVEEGLDEDEDDEDGDDLLPSASVSDDDDSGLIPMATRREPTAAERALFEEDDEVSEANISGIAGAAGATGTGSGSGTGSGVVVEGSVASAESALRKFIIKHELIRKGLHSSIGIFTLWLYTLGVHQTQLILPLSTLFAVIFTNDYIRFRNPELNQKIVKQFWFLIRDKEENQYNGTLYFLVGLVIIFSTCPKDISLMSVLLLSWADTAASTFGRQFGKYTPKVGEGKSLAGCIASFATGIISCYVLYGYFIPGYNHVNTAEDIMWTPTTSKLSFPVYAFLSGLIASLSEMIDIGGIDDNFTIPVLSGGFLYALVKWFQV
ncbi:CTP-dependent diacylglycerol kinase 1 [[Candida] railenensis]|uniref:CTP-dependent diacylglycerol kinase 1 n=1 Tax=[Candida] railenensis TaxID=45579 RepID=A0A9P0QU75_9ASCO|nr:CTP-dependent diacylglycerol kinase 1 [[Candida] railenensis]